MHNTPKRRQGIPASWQQSYNYFENERGTLKILCKTIEGYDRDFLKDQFLASIGRPWVEREEAVRAFTRFMGFRRAGEKIQDTVRSLINGLIREDRLESDGQLIRRKS